MDATKAPVGGHGASQRRRCHADGHHPGRMIRLMAADDGESTGVADSARPLISVVIATRNRRESLLRSLEHLSALPEGPAVVVVDNGSTDDTVSVVKQKHPDVRVISLPQNRGAVARNVGVAATAAPYIAFADDDSWWNPGSLARAVSVLESYSQLGGVIARVGMYPSGEIDRVSRKLARGDLSSSGDLPGPRALSFPAFSAVFRRSAFEQVGGFSPLLFFGGEEQLLAADLAAAGWTLCYLDEIIARHASRDEGVTPARWALQTRNDVLVLWLRRPLGRAALRTAGLAARATRNRAAASAFVGVVRRLPAALSARKRVPPQIDRDLQIAERPE